VKPQALPPVYVRRTATAFRPGDRVRYARAHCVSLGARRADGALTWERRGTVVPGAPSARVVRVAWDDAPEAVSTEFAQTLALL